VGIGLLGLFAGIPESAMFASFLILSVAYYGMFTRVWRALTFLSRSINRRAMAKMDRRVGIDRRQRDEIYYVDGIPKERRSGKDRRQNGGDRRSAEDMEKVTLVDVDQEQLQPSRDKAARIGSDPSVEGGATYQ
jgi:hypothetical protein